MCGDSIHPSETMIMIKFSSQRTTRKTASLLLPLLGTAFAHAGPLTGITEVRMDGAAFRSTEGNEISIANVRINSDQSTFDDYIEARYGIDHSTGSLALLDANIFPEVGVYLSGDNFLAKDVPGEVFMYRNPNNQFEYAADLQYNLSASNGPYYMNLTAGQSMTFHFSGTTDPMNFILTSPSGIQMFDLGVVSYAGDHVVISGVPIFASGVYRIDFVPQDPGLGRIRFRFLNENRRGILEGVPGARLQTTLRSYSRDYAKIKVSLNAGQTITFQPNRNMTNMNLRMCNSKGGFGSSRSLGFSEAGIHYTPLESDDYYFFFFPDNPRTASNLLVDLTVQISDALSYERWAHVHGISSLAKRPEQDADSDGISNLTEYSLGSSPTSARSRPDTNFGVSNNQLQMSYIIPSYVEGITVSPEVATGNLQNWIPIAPASQTEFPGGVRYEVMSSGAGNSKFIRLKIHEN